MTDAALAVPDSQASSYEALMARARALVPRLRERAQRTEELRRLPEETKRELHESGLFRIVQPKRVGGAELDYVSLVDFPAELAKGCASTGWLLANLASHHWMLGLFPEAAQDRIWSESPDALIASSFVFSAGRAERVEGGYVISGRWPFSSGVDSSDWNMLTAFVERPEGPPEQRIFLVHRSDYRIIDTWHAAGLRGTESNDVECRDVFVPGEMTLAVSELKGGPTPGSSANPNPLYALPVFALFPFVISGVALGNAEGVWADYVASIRGRASRYTGARISELQSTQIKIAEAGARIDTARRIMRSACLEAMADARRGVVPDIEAKLRYRRDGAYSARLCTEAVDILFAASGAGGLYTSNHLQRAFRDAHAIAAHIVFNFDVAGAAYGRVAAGFETDNPTL